MNAIDLVLVAVVAAALALAVRSIVRSRRAGGCGACPYAGSCGHAGSRGAECEEHHA